MARLSFYSDSHSLTFYLLSISSCLSRLAIAIKLEDKRTLMVPARLFELKLGG